MVTRPVGLSRDLPPKRVMRANVDGHDMVVWRAADGTIAAWDNRCPHRGMALSHGFVRGTSLACLYHGWHFSATGQCNHIPAHPDLEPPETIRTSAYSVVEESGIIWVSADAKAVADPFDFVRAYQKAVTSGEPGHRFSAQALDGLAKLEKLAWQ